ncbi:hypothetical protein Bca52824_023710 [Brassica carinata]|uniref:SUF system FeS cluster assembly SufBD core domain-containing protein n=1 Tax=Brassica carinata TaxID=52824 RepID=A0A8X7VIA7_BRACI|nr:hypothetical protein Bca52824_023710 [Brassica carinata]
MYIIFNPGKEKSTHLILNEADPQLLNYFDKLATIHRKTLEKSGVIFYYIVEAIGSTAPSYDTNQLHAAAVEIYCAEAREGAEIKYSTVQKVQSKAQNAKNTSTCDSRLIGDKAAANTYPYIQVKKTSARVELEASTSNTGEDQLFWLISAFCRDVFNNLSDEFGAEINELMSIKLEGSVG